MNAAKLFYSKLYSKQLPKLDGDQVKHFFDNPDIIRLSDELSANCEGNVTHEECENILGSF